MNEEHDWEERLADDIKRLNPQADKGFQQALETLLLAKLEQQEEIMQARSNGYVRDVILLEQPKVRPWRVSMALTLILLIIGISTLIWLGSADAPQSASIIEMTASPTMTRTPLPTLAFESFEIIVGTPFFEGRSEIYLLPYYYYPQDTTRIYISPRMEIPFVSQVVLVAISDIPRGVRIEREMLAETYWPSDVAPNASFANLDEVIGRYARVSIPRYSAVLATQLSQQPAIELVIPNDKVAIALPIDADNAAYSEGDRIDVLLSYTIFADDTLASCFDLPDYRVDLSVNEPSYLETRTCLAAENAEIISISVLDTVVMAVSSQEAELLAWAMDQNLPMSFVLQE